MINIQQVSHIKNYCSKIIMKKTMKKVHYQFHCSDDIDIKSYETINKNHLWVISYAIFNNMNHLYGNN